MKFRKNREVVKDIFTCRYIGGDGTEYNGGIWKKRETPKMIIFNLLEEPFFDINWKILKFKKNTKNTNRGDIRYSGFGSVMIDEEDGTYTIYPNQGGTPYIFEPKKPQTK